MIPLARARLSLQGLAIGDAFGESLLAAGPNEAALRVAERRIEGRRPWRWTDDTAMALSIVEVLAIYAEADEDALAAAFARRFRHEPNRGYGGGASQLLERVARGEAWRPLAARMFGGQGSLGNGAAMRAAPLGAYFADDLDRVVVEALRSAAPTHQHPDGAAGAVAIAVAAALACRATLPAPAEFLAEVAARTPAGATRIGLERTCKLPASAARADVADALGTGQQVTAADTVPWCVWTASRHLASYEEAVWRAVEFDGDRDTTAAIVGGIVVLATGADAIPVLWRAAVEAVPDPLESGPA